MNTTGRLAVYPGTFDPITYGHLDIIKRVSKIFENVIIAVANNEQKDMVFSLQERADFLKQTIGNDYKNIKIDSFEGLLINYLRKVKADVIIRGLRVVTDFDYEFASASMNNKLAPEIETVFLMTNEKYSFISSSLIKEVVKLGGDVTGYAPNLVIEKLKERIKQ